MGKLWLKKIFFPAHLTSVSVLTLAVMAEIQQQVVCTLVKLSLVMQCSGTKRTATAQVSRTEQPGCSEAVVFLRGRGTFSASLNSCTIRVSLGQCWKMAPKKT